MTGSSLVSNSFLFFLSGLSSSLTRGIPSRDNSGGRFFGGSSSFLLGHSSRSAFLFTADVGVKAVTVAVATIGGSGSSFESRFNRGSFSSEPGRFDAYLNPGPLFCFEAKRLEKGEQNFISLAFLETGNSLMTYRIKSILTFPVFPAWLHFGHSQQFGNSSLTTPFESFTWTTGAQGDRFAEAITPVFQVHSAKNTLDMHLRREVVYGIQSTEFTEVRLFVSEKQKEP